MTLVNARYLLACKPHMEFIYCIISHSSSNKNMSAGEVKELLNWEPQRTKL